MAGKSLQYNLARDQFVETRGATDVSRVHEADDSQARISEWPSDMACDVSLEAEEATHSSPGRPSIQLETIHKQDSSRLSFGMALDVYREA